MRLRKFNAFIGSIFICFKRNGIAFNHSDSKEQLKLIRHWVRKSLK